MRASVALGLNLHSHAVRLAARLEVRANLSVLGKSAFACYGAARAARRRGCTRRSSKLPSAMACAAVALDSSAWRWATSP